MSLFREEASNARRSAEWLEGADVSVPSLGVASLVLLAAVIIVSALFLGLVDRQRVERADGVVVPRGGMVAVPAPSPGVLSRVLVAEGQRVERGQPLFEIEAKRQSPGDVEVSRVLKEQMEQQRLLLRDDLILTNAQGGSRGPQLEEQIRFLANRDQLIAGRVALKQQELRQAVSVRERVRSLAPGMLTILQVQQYERAVSDAKLQLSETEQQQRDSARELQKAIKQRGAIPVDIEVQKNALLRSMAELQERAARASIESAQVVVAPRSGVVSLLAHRVGEQLGPDSAAVYLVPGDGTLGAEFWVPSRVAGTLAQGTPVELHYTAFPSSRFERQHGRVADVSRVALSPEELRRVAGLTVAEPRFRVSVALDLQSVGIRGRRYPVRPLMSVEARFLLEREPLYRSLFAPGAGNAPDAVAAR